MQLINKDNIICGNNFSKHADVIFSERISSEAYPYQKKGNYLKVVENVENIYSSDVWFINKQFTIRKNTTIFCKTEALKLLFILLKDIPKEYEINLITHQSDITITKKLFLNKPKCIKEWFAVNVSYKNKNLHHIPLGISDDFRKRHVNKNYLNEMIENSNIEQKQLIYINYNQNTNEKIRSKIFKKLKKQNFIKHGHYGLEIKDYIKDLKSYTYILCPTGNGLDTYRLWETLIIGNNPVVNSVKEYLEFRDLPIYFFKDAKNLDIEYLNSKKSIINDLSNNYHNKDFLTTNYWMKNLNKKDEKVEELKKIEIIIDENLEKRYFRKFFFIKNLKSNIKVLRYYIFQYLNIFNYLRFFIRKIRNN